MLISLLVLSISCGKKEQAKKSTPIKYTKLSQAEIEIIMDNQELTCGSIDDGPCPAGVVRLLTLNDKQKEKSTVCSGFMVAKNILVTNHHCVSTVAECNDTYVAIYDGENYVRSKCKSIIKTAEDYEDVKDPSRAIDYSILEIADDFEGTTFTLAEKRALPGDSVTAWVVDHIGLDRPKLKSNPLEARITEFHCKVSDQAVSASIELENCPIIFGNSGSPVVNSDGQIVGVIWGASKPDINSLTDLSIRREVRAEGFVTEMIHFAADILF